MNISKNTLKLLFSLLTILILFKAGTNSVNAAQRTYDCEWRTAGRVDRCLPIYDEACEASDCELPAPSACSGIRDNDVCEATTGNACACTDSPLGQGSCGANEIYTGIGCIPVLGETEFINFFLRWAIGIAGGIALILIVYAGILITTSAGDPKKMQSGKELLTAAISGFLFLLFSVLILEFVGVDILQIPGF